ncbi:MAG: cysteine--tRNA ligase [Nitrospirae bacterium]|nr:cysteine--tRNA ligase [Nitrospirota bacterium]
MLRLYNTLTGKKEPFEPLIPGHVGMYVCGVTVYDVCHIGHARSALVFDGIRRYLEYKGFHVTYVKNFTDIDDKIITRAQKEGGPWKEIAERYIEEYNRDMEMLGVRKADREPRATDHIEEMQKIIDGLMLKNHAYRTDGDVYYRVRSFGGYGRLSGRDTEEMLAGARVEVDERKEDPLDFALWKESKAGEPAWTSPWGGGRPGWHIECSAMSMKYLGMTFDIHGGGKDLIFPHHENEIAQSEAYTGRPFARYWVHNGFVNVNQEKMSKSLGNFFTIREVFEKYPYTSRVTAEVLRYFLLSSHYRSPVDFSDPGMASAHAALDSFYAMFQKTGEARQGSGEGIPVQGDKGVREGISECRREFLEAMDDDFNTAAAIGSLQKLRREVNARMAEGISAGIAEELENLFKTFGNILGLFSYDPFKWEFNKTLTAEVVLSAKFGIAVSADITTSEEVIQKLISEREEARKKKDWKRSDEIRDRLSKAGITIEDRPDGTTRIKR